jgi:DNA polymerase-3 subunit alpha
MEQINFLKSFSALIDNDKLKQIENNPYFIEECNVVSSIIDGTDYYLHIINNINIDKNNKNNSYIMWVVNKVDTIDQNSPTVFQKENYYLPDIDSDFAASKRDIILEYIKNKYGHDHVAELITYGTLQGRGALKDVLRVYNACDFTTMNNITALFPKRDQVSDKLAEFKEDHGTDSLIIYSLVTDQKAFSDYCHYDIETNTFTGEYAKYFEIAVKLEGAIKSEAKHPCAVIISDKPITESAPLYKDKNGDLLCAYDAGPAESVGLVKYDILGISALDKLQTLNEILAEHGIK